MAGNKMELISNKGGRPPKKLDDKQIAQVEALASVLTKARLADYFGMTEKHYAPSSKQLFKFSLELLIK